MLTVPQIRQRLSFLLTWGKGFMPLIEDDGMCALCGISLNPIDNEDHSECGCAVYDLLQLQKELT